MKPFTHTKKENCNGHLGEGNIAHGHNVIGK